MCDHARRQGGFEGVQANPPFGLQKIVYTALNCVTTALVSLQLRITAVQTSLVVATWLSLWRTSAECAYKYIRRRLRARSPIVPTYCSANLSTFSCGNSKSAGLACKHTWTTKNWMRYSTSHVATSSAVPKWPQKQSQSIKFPGGACTQTPLVMHAYIHIRHLRKPPSKKSWLL